MIDENDVGVYLDYLATVKNWKSPSTWSTEVAALNQCMQVFSGTDCTKTKLVHCSSVTTMILF